MISFFFYNIFSYSKLTLSEIYNKVFDFSSKSKVTFYKLFYNIFLAEIILSISDYPDYNISITFFVSYIYIDNYFYKIYFSS